MKETKHNGEISFWKFLFSIMVVLRHVEASNPYFTNFKYTFVSGALAVDFFFIVSGYLMAKTALKKVVEPENIGKETFNYILKKIKAFLPYIIIAVCIQAVIFTYNKTITTPKIFNYIFDISLLPMIFIYHSRAIGVAWYISAMLVSMIILYPCLLKKKKNFIYINSILICLFLYGMISRFDKSLAGADIFYFNFIPKNLLRALADMSLGCYSLIFIDYIKKINFTKLAKILLTIFEITGLSSIFYVVNLKGAHENYGFVSLIIMFVCIIISFSEKTCTYKLAQNKLFFYLEKISLPIYLNHMWIIDIINIITLKKEIKLNYYLESIIAIIISLIVSIILNFIITKISNQKKLNLKLKQLFIQ